MAGIEIDSSTRARLRRYKTRNEDRQTYEEAIDELLDEVGWEVDDQDREQGEDAHEVEA